MFTLQTILIILFFHWVADFKFQTHYQATNKSKNNLALALHVDTYCWTFLIPAVYMLGLNGIYWVALNGVLHFITDYVTSRINSKLWAKQDWHYFFEAVGADQLFHYTCMFSTYLLFV